MAVPYTTESRARQIAEEICKEKAGSKVLPNVLIEGTEPSLVTLGVDGQKFVIRSDTSTCVHKTGNEDILGTKHFKGFVLCDESLEVGGDSFTVHTASIPGQRPTLGVGIDILFRTDLESCPNPKISYSDGEEFKTKNIVDLLNTTECIHKTGTETITGLKTFSEIRFGDPGVSINENGFSGQGVYLVSGALDPLMRVSASGSTTKVEIRPTNVKSTVGSTTHTYSFPTSDGTFVVAPACPNDGNKYKLVCQNGVCSWEAA